MTDDTTTIEITEEQRDELRERKRHQREGYKDVIARLLNGNVDDTTDRITDLADQLDRIESAASTAEERTGSIENTLEGLSR